MDEIHNIGTMTTYMNTSETGAFLTNHGPYEEAVAARDMSEALGEKSLITKAYVQILAESPANTGKCDCSIPLRIGDIKLDYAA